MKQHQSGSSTSIGILPGDNRLLFLLSSSYYYIWPIPAYEYCHWLRCNGAPAHTNTARRVYIFPIYFEFSIHFNGLIKRPAWMLNGKIGWWVLATKKLKKLQLTTLLALAAVTGALVFILFFHFCFVFFFFCCVALHLAGIEGHFFRRMLSMRFVFLLVQKRQRREQHSGNLILGRILILAPISILGEYEEASPLADCLPLFLSLSSSTIVRL